MFIVMCNMETNYQNASLHMSTQKVINSDCYDMTILTYSKQFYMWITSRLSQPTPGTGSQSIVSLICNVTLLHLLYQNPCGERASTMGIQCVLFGILTEMILWILVEGAFEDL